MADNYLERHREQYEARKAEWLRRKRLHLTKKAPKVPTIERPADEAL